ncbi:MAG: hypothetical protein OER21_00175 [Gemmatimonadota bacterium]|nr:hypothetical protein [Gemmatimonadota bacterium]
MHCRARLLLPALLLASASTLSAQVSSPLDSSMLAAFRWRPIGPANMGGRITDIEGIPSPSKTFFVAAAAGGIWKTTNAGTSFRPVFDDERVISMGDLAIAPSDTMIVWAGTGEEDSRNSISPGGGIYKSTDGGLTWTLMGLTETQTVGRIVVHPTNPDIVYVAALGHIWGSNKERGLYKTVDGGTTWQLVKFVSDRAGFVDVAMHPGNPDVLFAASWERVRGPYFLKSGGPGSALWKTTDAGRTWVEVKGGGFPETLKGRIGIAIAPSDPNVIYTMVEADSVPGGTERLSGLYRSADGGVTWERTSKNNVRPFYYSQVRVHPTNPDRVYWSSTPVNVSDDGGKTAKNATVGIHVDHHALWFDPTDPDHFVVGNDGGVAQTWDGGGNYDFINILPLGQFYHVSYNMEIPYRVCGGLQDNGTWCGPSRRARGDITNFHWFFINGGDGFYTQQDPHDPNVVYAESQGGNMARLDLGTGERSSLQKPDWRQRWTLFEDSVAVDWPDTTVRPARALRQRLDDLRRRQRADSMALDLRWNWNTPFLISHHNPNVFYAGANKVLKSAKRGDDLHPISPDLTTRDTMRIRISTSATGGITPDITGAETHSTITALAESPRRFGLLFAGTDDGNVWMTHDDGGTWENLTGRFPGVPAKTWVSRIEPSHHDTMTVYVTFDRHREDDFKPYVYVTTDMGKTFRSIAATLPTGGPDFVHVIREDPHNRNLLFVGTDVGAYVSLDRGASWQRFMTGLPTVPVHDLAIHPRDRELIAATHGRSIWIVDIAPLEQLADSVLTASAHLFVPKTAYEFGDRPIGGGSPGHKWFSAPGVGSEAEFVYRLTSGEPRARARLVITDVRGDTVQVVEGPGGPGVHRATWNFRARPTAPDSLSPAQRRDSTQFMQRVEVVFDSLAQAGMNPMMLDRIKQAIKTGDFQSLARRLFGGGGGGQRPGGPARFNERPGETSGPAGRQASEGEGAQAGEEGSEAAMPGQSQLREIMQALRPPGTRGGGFGISYRTYNPGRRGAGPMVDTGDYLVTLVAGDQTHGRVLRVVRTTAGEGSGFGFEEH